LGVRAADARVNAGEKYDFAIYPAHCSPSFSSEKKEANKKGEPKNGFDSPILPFLHGKPTAGG